MMRKIKVLLLFISLSVCLSLMSNTYSRYVASTTSDISATFSKWQILVNEYDITNETNSTLAIEPHIDENDNIAEGVIAPTSTGYFDIEIDPTNVNVSFKYMIALGIENQRIPDLMITKYIIINDDNTEGEEIIPENIINNEISNSLLFEKESQDFKFKPFTVRVYFEWIANAERQMTDDDDTAIGLEAAESGLELKMSANISFEQIIE